MAEEKIKRMSVTVRTEVQKDGRKITRTSKYSAYHNKPSVVLSQVMVKITDDEKILDITLISQ